MIIKYNKASVKLNLDEYLALEELGKIEEIQDIVMNLGQEDFMNADVSEINSSSIDNIMNLIERLYGEDEEEE